MLFISFIVAAFLGFMLGVFLYTTKTAYNILKFLYVYKLSIYCMGLDLLGGFILRTLNMNTVITYYYENALGVFSMVRNINAQTVKDIENNISEMRILIKSRGDKPLTHEIIFK